MKGVETIARIRREFFRHGKSIKEMVRDLHVSRNTVRKVLRSGATAFEYSRSEQPRPKLGRWQGELDGMLSANEAEPRRERLTLIRLYEALRDLGYGGGYDAVRRYARVWRRERSASTADAYVPLSFAPGEAHQFDWSHEVVLIGGVTVIVKVAHVRLRRSLVEPVACTPASGWEKGQVENQVGLVRERFFTPRLRVKNYEELNAWLAERCVGHAKAHRHPELREQTVWQVFEAERPSLAPHTGRFDGFHAVPASVSKTCLVRFDNNKYSVSASAIGRPVEIRAYADRIELRQAGRLVGEHRRCFGRDQTVYDPWRYVPVLARKPGALRNGAPFKDWVPPAALERVRRKLAGTADGDRQMVDILAAVLSDGLPAVEAACGEALRENVHSAAVALNILARRREPAMPIAIMTPEALRLRHEPAADCARYDSLRRAL